MPPYLVRSIRTKGRMPTKKYRKSPDSENCTAMLSNGYYFLSQLII